VKGYVALEYCPHGDLYGLIRDKSAVGFDLVEMVGYMVDLFSAVAHVHRCGIVHRDIKPANILCQAVDGQNYWQLRLADFGLAAVCPASGYSLLGHGTVQYMPVEQLLGFCNSACDVWAAGCILFELLTCEILVPDSASWDNSVVLEFLCGECLGAKLDEAVLCYGRKADISVGLLKVLTLDWCRRPGADESLFYFSSGASGSSGSNINVVDLPSDIGLACAPHSPPPFLPQSWLAYWASDKVAWYFARSDDLDRATWSVPPCVPKPWGVYWSRTRNAFYFKNECKLEYVWDEALLHTVQADFVTGAREDADVDSGGDACAEMRENVNEYDDATIDLHFQPGVVVDATPVSVSGQVFHVNALRAMAILEAVHSGARMEQRFMLLDDGRRVQMDTLLKLASCDGLLE